MTAAKAINPESIYFGGVTATGGARILLAAAQAGLADIPYVGPTASTMARRDEGLVPEPRGRRRQELVQHAGRHRRLPRQGPVRPRLPGRVRDRRDRLRGHGLRLRPGRHRRHRPRPASQPCRQGRPPRGGPRRGHGHDRTYDDRPGDINFNEDGDTSQKIVSIYRSILPARTARATGSSRPRSTTPSSRSGKPRGRGSTIPGLATHSGPASTSQAKDPRDRLSHAGQSSAAEPSRLWSASRRDRHRRHLHAGPVGGLRVLAEPARRAPCRLRSSRRQRAVDRSAIYALIALGYTMVYGIIELINFAHGDVFMIGAFLASSGSAGSWARRVPSRTSRC